MRSTFLTAAAAISLVAAVFQDEVGHIDFHHELLGLPLTQTTLFHRPRLEERASLLYTFSDLGILGAVNPSSGAVVWRQQISENTTTAARHLRASDGESWVVSALGPSIHAWSAINGRNVWKMAFPGEVKDLEIMEMTESSRKDVLALSQETGATTLRRLDATTGSVVWEFSEKNRDLALQVSTNVEKVFLISLHGTPASYNLKITVLDTLTGKRLDEISVGTKGDVHGEQDVMFVGANSAAPVLAWTDQSLSKLRVNVLGTKQKQEFALGEGTVSVTIHAPHLIQSQPHFLVHSRTTTGNRAEVYHVDLKTNVITKAYDLPHLPGLGAFSTSSSGANVFFTRVSEDEVSLTQSTSHGVIGRWPLKTGEHSSQAVSAVSEVVKKAGDQYAVRSAVLTDSQDWILIRNGEVAWSRPEGLSGVVAAAFAELPESEQLAKALDQEAHSNPLAAYVHRVRRHIKDLEHLPDYLKAIPARLVGSILGTERFADNTLTRDSFGFHKIAVLATKRGRLYGLDVANHGRILWSHQAFELAPAETWAVKGIHVDDAKGHVMVRGAGGEYIVVRSDNGRQLEIIPKSSSSEEKVQSTALVDTPAGPFMLNVGPGGKIGDLPALVIPKQTVVVRGLGEELKGVKFVQQGAQAVEEITWTFKAPSGSRIAAVGTRPAHDVVASLGRVLGDRSVLFKYLNPTTITVATMDDRAGSLTISLLDTVSGQLLSSSTHTGIDPGKPVDCTISENFFLCSYFGEYKLEGQSQTIKGYQVTVSDLYESSDANDRGPLGNSPNLSAINPIDLPTGASLPYVVSQTFVLGASISALAVTQTRQGISSRLVLAYLPGSHSIIGLPKTWLEPRRPVGRDPTSAEQEEGLFRYSPNIEIDPKNVITHERDVVGIQRILTTPSLLESSSLVLAFGVDVFGTRVAPSFAYDVLGKGFNKLSMIGTVVALGLGVVMLGPMVGSAHTLKRPTLQHADFSI
jgi:ER membrane protein complex subunit 1